MGNPTPETPAPESDPTDEAQTEKSDEQLNSWRTCYYRDAYGIAQPIQLMYDLAPIQAGFYLARRLKDQSVVRLHRTSILNEAPK